MDSTVPEWLTTEQVAALLQVSEQKLKKDRLAKVGLPFTRLGRTIRYRRSEVDRFLELSTVSPYTTSA